MRKNINKLVAFAIGISVMSGTAVPVFAADTTTTNAATTAAVQNSSTSVQAQTTKPVLTLDESIKAAISNDDKLAYDEKAISYRNKINDNKEELDSAMSVGGDTEDFNQDTRDNTLNQLKQQRDFDEDTVIQKTTKAYNDLVTKQMTIERKTKLLEIKNKELNDQKLKKSLGLVTSIDLSDAELQIGISQNQLTLNINQLKDAQDSFKVLTGKDATQFTLEQDIKYEKFKIDGSVDEYLDNIIDGYLKLKIDALKLNKDNLDDNEVTEDNVTAAKTRSDNAKLEISGITFDGSKASTDAYNTAVKNYEADKSAYTTTLSARITYLTSKLSIYENQTNLEITKKQLKDSLKQLYTTILSTEDSIDSSKQKIEINNKKLSNAKLKYDLGLMTKSDYTKLIVDDQGSDDLDIQLRTTVDTYNTLKEKLQKPWIQ